MTYRLPTGRLASEIGPSHSKSDSGRSRPHDAADVLVAVEHVVVVIRLLAARAGFGGAFEYQRAHAVRIITCCQGQGSFLPPALQRMGRVA